MTIDDAIAKARKAMDAEYQVSLPALAQTLVAHGATDKEYERAMELARSNTRARLKKDCEDFALGFNAEAKHFNEDRAPA